MLRRAHPPRDLPRAVRLTPPELGASNLSLDRAVAESAALSPDVMDRRQTARHRDVIDLDLVGDDRRRSAIRKTGRHERGAVAELGAAGEPARHPGSPDRARIGAIAAIGLLHPSVEAIADCSRGSAVGSSAGSRTLREAPTGERASEQNERDDPTHQTSI